MNRVEPRPNLTRRLLYLVNLCARIELIGGVIFAILFLSFVAVTNHQEYPSPLEPETATIISNPIQ